MRGNVQKLVDVSKKISSTSLLSKKRAPTARVGICGNSDTGVEIFCFLLHRGKRKSSRAETKPLFPCHFWLAKSNPKRPLMAKFLKILPSRGGSLASKVSQSRLFVTFITKSYTRSELCSSIFAERHAFVPYNRNVNGAPPLQKP